MTKKNPSVLWTVDQSPISIISKDAKKVARKNIGIDIADPGTPVGDALEFLSEINAPDGNGNITFKKKTVTVTADTFDNTKASSTQDKTTPVTAATIKKAIESLDGTTVTASVGEFIDQVSEADGIVSASTKAFDTALSDSSKNAVQNMVINAALSGHKHTVQFNNEAAIDLTCNNANAISLNHKHGELASNGTMDNASYGVVTDGNKNLVTADLSSPSATLDSNTALTFVTGVTAGANGQITSITTANVSKSDATNSNVSTTLATSKAVYDVQQNLTTHTHNELNYNGTMANANCAVVTDGDKKIKTENHNDWWSVPLSGSPDNRATDDSSYVTDSGKRALVAIHQNSAGKIDTAYYHELSYVDAFSATTNYLQYTTGTNSTAATLLAAKDGITIDTSKNIYCALTSYTKLSYASQTTPSISGNSRLYPVSLDSNGKLSVIVPWENGETITAGVDLFKTATGVIKVNTNGTTGGIYSIVFGAGTTCTGNYSIAGGYYTTVGSSATDSFAFGERNEVNTNLSVALGQNNKLYDSVSNSSSLNFAIGSENTVGTSGTASGTNMYRNILIGSQNSITMKSGATEANDTILIGYSLQNVKKVGNGCTVVVGAYNDEPINNSTLIIGSPKFSSSTPAPQNIAEMWASGRLWTLDGYTSTYHTTNTSNNSYDTSFNVYRVADDTSAVSNLDYSDPKQYELSVVRSYQSNTTRQTYYYASSMNSNTISITRYYIPYNTSSVQVTAQSIMRGSDLSLVRYNSERSFYESSYIGCTSTAYPRAYSTVYQTSKAISQYSIMGVRGNDWGNEYGSYEAIVCGGIALRNIVYDSDTSTPLYPGGLLGEITPVVHKAGTSSPFQYYTGNTRENSRDNGHIDSSYVLPEDTFTLVLTSSARISNTLGNNAILCCGWATKTLWASDADRIDGYHLSVGTYSSTAQTIVFC